MFSNSKFRTSVKCECKKSVFQKYNGIYNTLSINEINILLYKTRDMQHTNRSQLFEDHGIDLNAVESHFKTVKTLDDIYNEVKETDHVREKKHSIFWLWILQLIQFYFSTVFTKF